MKPLGGGDDGRMTCLPHLSPSARTLWPRCGGAGSWPDRHAVHRRQPDLVDGLRSGRQRAQAGRHGRRRDACHHHQPCPVAHLSHAAGGQALVACLLSLIGACVSAVVDRGLQIYMTRPDVAPIDPQYVASVVTFTTSELFGWSCPVSGVAICPGSRRPSAAWPRPPACRDRAVPGRCNIRSSVRISCSTR